MSRDTTVSEAQARFDALAPDAQQRLLRAIFALQDLTATAHPATLSDAPAPPGPPTSTPTPRLTHTGALDYSAAERVLCEVMIVQGPRKPTPQVVAGTWLQLQGYTNVRGPKGGRYALLTGQTPLGTGTIKFALDDFRVLSGGGTAEAWVVLDATPGRSVILGTLGAFRRR